MASPNARARSISPAFRWQARPGCPATLVNVLKEKVNSFPSYWLNTLYKGEIFKDLIEARDRYRAFALAEGFEVVKGGGGGPLFPAARFHCFHHSIRSRNWRKLEDEVERDKDGDIISKRRRQATHVHGSACPWLVVVSFKGIGGRFSGQKGFITSIKSLEYKGHPLLDNPLAILSYK